MRSSVAEASLPTEYGEFRLVCHPLEEGKRHIALVKGHVGGSAPVLVRLHSQCMTGDVFLSLRCDCGPQLALAMAAIERAGSGVVVYLEQEGRGIGLANKIRAYRLQEAGLDTVDANTALGLPVDGRDYGVAARMLGDLGVRRVRLMTNNPAKVAGLIEHGIDVAERIPVRVRPDAHNARYLAAKRTRLGHFV